MKNRNNKQILQNDQYSDSEISGVNSMDSGSFISDDEQQQTHSKPQTKKIQDRRFLNNDDEYGPDITPDISEDSYKQNRNYRQDLTPDISRDDEYGPDITPDISQDKIKQYDDYGPDITPDITPNVSKGKIKQYDDYGPDITPDISDNDYQDDEQLLGDLDQGGLVDNKDHKKQKKESELELNLSSTFEPKNQQKLQNNYLQNEMSKSKDDLRSSQGSQSFLKKNKQGQNSNRNTKNSLLRSRENISQQDEYDFDNLPQQQNPNQKNKYKNIIQSEENFEADLDLDEQNIFQNKQKVKVQAPSKIQITKDDDDGQQIQELDNIERGRDTNNNLQLPKKSERKRSKSKKAFQRKGLSPKNLKDIKELRKLKKEQQSVNSKNDINSDDEDAQENIIEEKQQFELLQNDNKKRIKPRPIIEPEVEPQEDQIMQIQNDEELLENVSQNDEDQIENVIQDNNKNISLSDKKQQSKTSLQNSSKKQSQQSFQDMKENENIDQENLISSKNNIQQDEVLKTQVKVEVQKDQNQKESIIQDDFQQKQIKDDTEQKGEINKMKKVEPEIKVEQSTQKVKQPTQKDEQQQVQKTQDKKEEETIKDIKENKQDQQLTQKLQEKIPSNKNLENKDIQQDNKEQKKEEEEQLNNDEDLMTFDFKQPKKKVNKKFLQNRFQNKKKDTEKEVQENDDNKQSEEIEIALPKKNNSTKKENQTNQKAQSKIENFEKKEEDNIEQTNKEVQEQSIKESKQKKEQTIKKTTKSNLNQKEQPIKSSQINNIQMDEQPIKPAEQPSQEQSLPTEQPPEQPIQNKPNPFSAEALANHPDAFPADELDPTKAGLEDLGEIPDTLETRLKSKEFKQRVEAYKELQKWDDPELTPEVFFKTLHLTIKEKHQNVIPPMLQAIQIALEDPDKKEQALAALNLPKFVSTFCEHTINNAKKPGAKKAVKEFVGKFYDAVEDKSAIIEEIKNSGKSFSPKVQEPVLYFIELLLSQDKIKELDVITSLTELVAKLAGSRSQKIIKNAMNVIKEMALYFGEGVKDFFKELKKEQIKEISDYLKDLDPKKMKALGGDEDDGKDIQAKLYEMAKEQEMPAEYADDQFTDSVLEMPKWKDKQDAIQKLAAALKPIQKLNPKTKIFHIVTLVKQMFQQSIVILQVESLKPVQFLSNSLRKNMKHEAKDIFDTMMKNFQTRTRNLNDEITKTTLKLFNCFDLADIYDLLKTSLKKTKSNFKKFNIINLIKNIVDKTNQVSDGEVAKKVVNLVLPDIEFNDNKVREKVAQIIAKMKDKYNEKVQPLLSDLNPQKMKIILKFCTNPMFKQDEKDKVAEGEQEQQKDNKDGEQQTQIGKTKSQKIANMRENLFSNKTYKISDTANFAKYLEVNLKNLGDITKDFKEVNQSQAKEIYILIEEISKKVSKQAFTQVSREIIAKFYIELITQKYSDEIYDSIQEYLSSKNKIITTRIFLNDLFDVITMKNIKVTRDLLSVIIRLMIDKLRNKGNLNSISHKNFVDFLKNNFASQTLHASVKTIIVNLMRILQKKYGERALSDYPATILKDFETQNKEIEKNFNRTLEKLNDKSEDKRTTALNEIANYKDLAKIVLFWTAKPFQQYLRTALQETTKEDTFKILVMIVQSYLELYEKSRNEFNIKNYLYVFQVIIKRYYDQNLDQNKSSIDQIFLKSVEILSPTMILNNMVSDSNAMSWKEEIFHFYLQYGSEINIKVKFINFIVQVISSSKNNSVEIKTLIDNVLLMLKSIDNDEIIIKGNENKLIREVWQKKEEDVLFEQRFVKSYKVFEDISFFNSAKIFIDQSLHFQNYEFFDKDITQIVIEQHDSQLKIKLAYYYLRSIENISFINEHIFNQIAQLDSNTQKKDSIYIILKILFNLLRNNAAAYEETFYMDVKDYFTQYFNQNGETPEELQKNLSLTGFDYRFLNVILQSLEDQQIERSYIGSPRGQNYNSFNNTSNFNPQTPGPYRRGMDDDTSYIQGNMNDNLSNNTPIQFGKNKMNSQYVSQLSIHPRENSPNKSKVSYGKNGRNQAGLQTPRIDNEDLQELEIQIQNMLTFNFENFQLANKYFEREMRENKRFLCEHSKFIIDNFISILIEIFGDGINFDVSKENYQLIFDPLQTFCSDKDFMNSLEQPLINQFVREILCRLVDANEQKNYIQKYPDQAYHDENEDQQLSPLEKAELASSLMKSFNSLMLKVISKLDINSLITSLFTFIFECLKTDCVEPNDQLYDLASKCLIKIFKDLKKYQNALDPRVLFSLVAEFLEMYNPQSGYKDNLKTIQMMLKKVMLNNQIDYITQCYHDVFGDHTVGLIWDLILYFRQNQQQQPMMSPQEAHERLIEQIQIINSQNDFSQLAFFTNQISQILRMCPQINFFNYAGQFANGNFFEYLANQLGLNNNMSQMNSMQNSRSNLYNDQSFMTSQNVSRY